MDHTGAKNFRTAMETALTAAAPSPESSTRGSNTSSEAALKRHFLQVFRRWEAVFKRADRGDEVAEKWLVAQYFKALGHLSPAGLEALSEQLMRKNTFFPTIRECLEIINVPQLSGQWGNPFINRPAALYQDQHAALAAPRAVGLVGDHRGAIDA